MEALDRLAPQLIQEPLVVKGPSAEGVRELAHRPGAIMVGLGLRARRGMTRGIPFDVIGLLLTARRVRSGWPSIPLVVVLGDAQALQSGACPRQVEAWVAEWLDVLRRLTVAMDLGPIQVVRSHELAASPEYGAALAEARALLPADGSGYCALQAADALALTRRYGALIKVGWALSRRIAWQNFDETGFDVPLLCHARSRIGFIYSRPGRAFSDERPRVVPYVACSREDRLLLEATEMAGEKLEHARRRVSRQAYRGAVRHLKNITRSWSENVHRLDGDLAARLSQIQRAVFEPAGSPRRSLHGVGRRPVAAARLNIDSCT